jgi:hypothetical protein
MTRRRPKGMHDCLSVRQSVCLSVCLSVPLGRPSGNGGTICLSVAGDLSVASCR